MRLSLLTVMCLCLMLFFAGHGLADSGTGTVLEHLDGGGYTYVHLQTDRGEKAWIATPKVSVAVGDRVSYSSGVSMKNFISKALNRTFDEILFVGNLDRTAAAAVVAPREPAAPRIESSPPVIAITSPAVKRGVSLVAKEAELGVAGRATAPSGIAKVTVNGRSAALDESGNFSADILLKPGENRLVVSATNTDRETTTESFTIVREVERVAQPRDAAAVSPQPVAAGTYHAVIIGNNDYRSLDRLKTAVSDAREVDRTLKDLYGFRTRLLLNATRSDILSALNELRKQVREQDSVLIYYAGHGEFDRTTDKSYWLPVDAQPDNDTDWIIAENITASVKRLAAKHVLIVSDSCYSGTLTRSSQTHLAPGERGEFLKKMGERPSRTLMASGGNEPVADSGGSGHSIFAETFLKSLREIDQPVFAADELFHRYVRGRVAGKSDQVPQYSALRNSGDDGGDFLFVRAK